jgi:two-component system, chemotaxis family, protein-glutamate methylesterase/glutaminase
MPTGRDIVCVGGSAGGLQPLTEIVRRLPAGLEASVFVVLHTGPETPTLLPDILRGRGSLPVEVVSGEEDIRSGRIYVAASDHHLLLKRGFVRAIRGPRENGFRPAVDPLFRTAARAYGPRVIGVVLSGGQNDGSAGLVEVHEAGGTTIVQEPEDAMVPEMPRSVLALLKPHFVGRPAGIAETIKRLATNTNVRERSARPTKLRRPDPAEFKEDALRDAALPGQPSAYTCPECGGALWDVVEGKVAKLRCHVGHGFTSENLLGEKDRELEQALWTALRSLEENASLRRRMAGRVQHRWPALAATYEKQAAECYEQSALLRKVLVHARDDGGTESRANRNARGRRSRRGTSRATSVRQTGSSR